MVGASFIAASLHHFITPESKLRSLPSIGLAPSAGRAFPVGHGAPLELAPILVFAAIG
jgi:hypothetical protein